MGIPYQFIPVAAKAMDAASQAGVCAAAQAAYVHIVRHHSGGITTISHARLAAKLCCSESSVRTYLNVLEQADLIRIERREGRCDRFLITAWVTPSNSEGDLDPLETSGSEEQPIKAVPIQDQDGSEIPQPDPEKKTSLVEAVVEGVKAGARKVTRLIPKGDGKHGKDRRPKPEGKPIKRSEQPTPAPDPIPKPVEQSGDASPAADAPVGPPPEMEQPRNPAVPVDYVPAPTVLDVFTAQNPPSAPVGIPLWELEGREAPPDRSPVIVKALQKACRPGPDGHCFYNDQLMTIEAVLNMPSARTLKLTTEAELLKLISQAPANFRKVC